MNVTTLSQWQFAITSIYHFFFVPLTLGLSILLAIMETLYVRSGNEIYKRMVKFWGKLFLINFAMGVATGIVMEFQFGMNWSQYARFVGDIFGAPLAIEALLAFFLESTFLGLWIFGWDKLSKKAHLTSIWLVAIGSNISALWILIANSFMQQPVGYTLSNGRAVMTDFSALLTNPNVWVQFPHVVLSGFVTGAFFILAISTYHLLRKKEIELFQKSSKIASLIGLISIVLIIGAGHAQAQHIVKSQPMKMAAMEALVDTENPASISLLSITDEEKLEDIFSIRIPNGLSLLAFNSLYGEVRGVRDLQMEYEKAFGPGDYVPPIFISYWSFRIMVGLGMLMLLIAIIIMFRVWKNKPMPKFKLMALAPFLFVLPYLSNTAGWVLTEIGRQPWVVYGLMKTSDAISPSITPGLVLTSLIGFTLAYGILMVVDIYLLAKFSKAGPETAA